MDSPGWQDGTLAVLLHGLQARLAAGFSYALAGSMVSGEVDLLSDLDLIVVTDVLPDASGDVALLSAAGPLWSIDRQEGHDARTLRMVYNDGRRVDLLLRTSAADLPEPLRWSPEPETRAPGPGEVPAVADPARPEVLAVRHVAALAAAKLGRRDLLIGGHLCLEVARQALVLSMRLRDEETGRTHHRQGGVRDLDAVRMSAALNALPADAGPEAWLDLLVRLEAVFDKAAAALWPNHRPDWQGLDAIVVAARTVLAEPSE